MGTTKKFATKTVASVVFGVLAISFTAGPADAASRTAPDSTVVARDTGWKQFK